MVFNIICTIKCNTMTVLWTTKKFRRLIADKGTFELETEKLVNWDGPMDLGFQFSLYSNGGDSISIYYMSPTTVFLKSTRCSLFYGNYEEREIEVKKNYTHKAKTWTVFTTLKMSDIRSCPATYFMHDLDLCLKFQFIFTNNLDINVLDTRLNKDFENMLNHSLFSDMIMKSAEDIEFKVHKAVLASRSAVLKAHFEHNTTECLTNIVTSPLETDVLREVLTFIYSDKAPRINEVPEKLLAAADYYQLSTLKSLCEQAIATKLTAENAIETLTLANLHSANTLQHTTLEFIKNDRAGCIMKTDGWAQVKSVELLKIICKHALVDKNN